ncbi:hypothetical protein NA78x_002723 [Anatilimnocola sp. NA78]|uniref:hypothetical protein n=1 Tax=Anatilimnocola sp. NA78 TaxID=3415683 RepID=UPI003CE53F78
MLTGFDGLNHAAIRSSLRRLLISYLMEQAQPKGPAVNFNPWQGGDRYSKRIGLGLERRASRLRPSRRQLHDRRLECQPTVGFVFRIFRDIAHHACPDLDLPLMFLLLDGSLVNSTVEA